MLTTIAAERMALSTSSSSSFDWTMAAPKPPSGLPARAWILVDADDGEVLAAHKASSSYSIAVSERFAMRNAVCCAQWRANICTA